MVLGCIFIDRNLFFELMQSSIVIYNLIPSVVARQMMGHLYILYRMCGKL